MHAKFKLLLISILLILTIRCFIQYGGWYFKKNILINRIGVVALKK